MDRFVKVYPKAATLPVAVIPIVLGFVTASVALTTIARLMSVDPTSELPWVQAVMRGNVLPMMATRDYWATFPSMPTSVAPLLHAKSAIAAMVFAAVSALLFRRLLRRSWSRAGATVLLLGIAPTIASALVPIPLLPTTLGRWNGVMATTLLYSAGCCIVLAMLDLLGSAREPAKRHERTSTPPAAQASANAGTVRGRLS